MEPRSGFTPHGTPESSLAVTTTTGSTESEVPQQQHNRALPAVPAIPAMPASRRERSDSSRQSSSSSASSSRRTTSTQLLRQAEQRKLLAALEVAQAKQALAVAAEADLLEKMSQRIEELEKALMKENRASLFARARSLLGRIFSRSNVELILSIVSLAVSCAVAAYVFFG